MRRAIISCTLSFALLSACDRSKQASAETSAIAAAEPKQRKQAGYQLTREKLTGYLRYHSLLASEATDAGPLEQQSSITERARAEAGLSIADLEQLEAMIPKVIGKRAFGRQLADEKSLENLQSVKAKVPLHHQRELDHLVEWNKAQRAEATSLAAERERYGNANVDLILSQEAELLHPWHSEIAQLTP